ncbi:MAG TPA: 50S ribosomal protein L25/general stress protein Ctc [Burkholderiales bacterium]|nr:50S ribosomal protein L25/general stress protein Ctc [Burkholderiales bacterium]
MEVTAYPRAQQGTGASRRLRRSGKVPGIVYGAGKDAQQIELDHTALLRHLKLEAFHASILDMTIDGSKQQVLLRDFQMHPWKAEVQHVDFQRIAKDRKIHMRVPLHFLNAETSPGVKVGGGVISHVMNDLDISCLPDDLPEFVEVDLGHLELGHAIHVVELKLPKGVELIVRLRVDNPVVATVQVPRALVVEETEAAAPVTEIIGEAAAEGAEAAGEKKEGEKKEPEKKEAAKKE